MTSGVVNVEEAKVTQDIHTPYMEVYLTLRVTDFDLVTALLEAASDKYITRKLTIE